MATGAQLTSDLMSGKDQQHSSNPSATNSSSEEWLLLRVGSVPRNSLGWFRCGVGFYNKKEYIKAIECFEKSVQLDPMNVNLDDSGDLRIFILTKVLTKFTLFQSSIMHFRSWQGKLDTMRKDGNF